MDCYSERSLTPSIQLNILLQRVREGHRQEVVGRERHLHDLRVSHNRLHDHRKVPENLRHGMLGDHQEVGISMEIKEIGKKVKEIGQELMHQLRREGDQAKRPKDRLQRNLSLQTRPKDRLRASISLRRPMHRLQEIGDQELNQKIGRMELNQKEGQVGLGGRHTA